MAGNKLVKRFLEYALGSGAVLLLGFISAPINTRLFTPEEFGEFSMFVLFTNIVNVLVLMGLDQSFIRFFYEEKNQKRLLYQTIKYPLIVCSFLTIFIIIFWQWVSKTLFNTNSIEIIILFIITNFLLVFNRFSFLVIRMQQKGKLYSYLQVLQKIINILIILITVKITKDGFFSLTIAMLVSCIIVTFVSIILSRDLWELKSSNREIKTKNNELMKFGFPLMFTFLITLIFQFSDRVFIQYFNGYTELGLYSAAFSIVALLNAVQTAFSTFWVPVAYEHYEKNRDDKIFFKSVNSIVSLFMFFIGIILILFKDLIILILGEDFREAASIMPFLIFMPIMYTISETTVLGINFKKKPQYHIIIALLSAIASILGNVILVPIYGATGAAISTGLAYILFFVIRTIISNRFYKVNYELKKFYFMTLSLSLFAFYATFNNLDAMYLFLGLINLTLLVIIYRNNIILLKDLIKKNK
ncbi:lipopolysaccharide biosynthesis protein [Peribacillus simplex]|uniref:lipopolysaccharide biosynthesis protein n=1 Tax=Peribacillus simplex TaxID=1478 RepID=UPI003CF1C562